MRKLIHTVAVAIIIMLTLYKCLQHFVHRSRINEKNISRNIHVFPQNSKETITLFCVFIEKHSCLILIFQVLLFHPSFSIAYHLKPMMLIFYRGSWSSSSAHHYYWSRFLFIEKVGSVSVNDL